MRELEKELTREEWLEARDKGLGGSEIAVIANLNKWQTPYQLFLVKTGQIPGFMGNEKTDSGSWFESGIEGYFFHKNPQYTKIPTDKYFLYHHPVYPYILGSPDSRFIDDLGRHQILEIKNTETNIDWDFCPESWYCQATFYAGNMGYKHFTICALVRGYHLTWHTFDLDQSFYEYLLSEGIAFWNDHILTGIPPVSTNSDDVVSKYPLDNGEFLEADSEVIEQHKKLLQLAVQEKQIGEASDSIKEELKLRLNDSLGFIIDNKPLITWKSSKGSLKFDEKAFKNEYPEMHSIYAKPKVGSRVFLVKPI